jgi:hypothetical protein
MSWIDIFLSDGDPHRVYGADARQALSRMMRLRELPALWIAYGRAGLPLPDRLAFLALDVVRGIAYRRGFRDGADFPWPEEPR